MNHWTLAFVGEGAQADYEATRREGVFCVSSNRTPAGRARAGDGALLYLAGEGFVAEAVISSNARHGVSEGSGNTPSLWEIRIGKVRPFERPVRYRFPQKGEHPILGFHRYSLACGFVAMSQNGFEEVLAQAGADGGANGPREPRREPAARAAPGLDSDAVSGVTSARRFEKRAAGQHALAEGRKRAMLWTVAETGASAFGLKGLGQYARGKARNAEKTWLAGGKAEERVGAEIEKLREHGFYAFHDVPLPGIGNVDHVVLGESGFFCVETKSHKGRVTRDGSGELLVNGRHPEKDFVKQTWRGCYKLREILGPDVRPILLFTDAFVEGHLVVRGVLVMPLVWLVEEILRTGSRAERRHDRAAVKAAVNALGSATGSYPSATPRLA